MCCVGQVVPNINYAREACMGEQTIEQPNSRSYTLLGPNGNRLDNLLIDTVELFREPALFTKTLPIAIFVARFILRTCYTELNSSRISHQNHK